MGQISEIWGVLGMLVFMAMVIYNAIYHPVSQKPINPNDWDMIPVGTSYAIAKKPAYEPKTKHKVKVEKPRAKVEKPRAKVEKPKVKPKKDEGQLYNDCVATLVGLGEKKSVARRITATTFVKHNPKTLEEFIRVVFKK